MLLTDRVLMIDAEAIVIDKPAGLPVDPPRDGGISMSNHLESLAFGFKRWPVVIHRLDRDTSGCLLLARNPKAAARFTQAFDERRVTKSYLAVVDGRLDADAGTIDLPLIKVSSAEEGWFMSGTDARTRGAKSAVTHWARLAEADGRTLVRMVPETGRTHQLRAHARDGLGHAIAGDPVYGARAEGAHPARRGVSLLLHAERLIVPREGKPPVDVVAPFPDRFAATGFAAPAPDPALPPPPAAG